MKFAEESSGIKGYCNNLKMKEEEKEDNDNMVKESILY